MIYPDHADPELVIEELQDRLDTCSKLLLEYLNADYLGINPPDKADLYAILDAINGLKPKYIGTPERR